jgi:3-hydroxy-9,10-secoandrosta-1,3,5(10)-triene-9,17-dione monooxygenase
MFDGRAQQDVWGASRDSLVASGFLPAGRAARVDGGFRLSGRWPFSSGCDHADWALVRSFVPGDSELPELHMFLVPKSDYAIIDGWHVMGMSGTGSKDFELKGEVFVPEHRTLSDRDLRNGTGPGSAFNGGALYRLPRHATVPFSLAAPLVGMAERTLQLIVQNMRERSAGERRSVHEGAIHIRVAESAAEIDAARALMLRDCREAMEIARQGGQMGLDLRARNRRDIAYVASRCTRALDRLYAAAGARSIFLDGEVQRLLRDIHAAGQHMALNWDVAGTNWSRVAAGLPPGQDL